MAESELVHTLPSVIGTAVKINKVINIPPEPIQLKHTVTEQMVDIPIPSSHIGAASVVARLICAHRREGMMGEKKRSNKPPATGLLFHCHGGGFVAQSSKSHEMYLRDWAVTLNIPILSIDYSLAPDAPFPRAVEEVFYAYCWAIKNCLLLGTTADRIIFAGDSAGANLILTCALKSIEMNIRKPDGIFLAYCPVRVNYDSSPSRLLCVMDPLLPFGFLMRCLKAYTCPSESVIEKNKKIVSEKDAIKYAKSQNNNASDSVASNNKLQINSLSESEMPTFVNISERLTKDDKTDNSESLNESSLWEHIDFNVAGGDFKSPGSDGTSDTFASASLHSQTVGNTEMMTPDESNGISFEEDSQPITIHRPYFDDEEVDVTYAASDEALTKLTEDDAYRSLSAANAIELEQPVQSTSTTESTKFVNEFVQRYVLDTENGAVLRPITESEEHILSVSKNDPSDAITVQNIQNKICQVVDSVTTSMSNTITSMTASTPIRECAEFSAERSRLDSLIPKSPTEEFLFDIPRDPLLSPFWASDEVLSQLPPTQILVSKI